MRASKIAPTGVERHFDEDELIVSKTDTRGIITYANDLFLSLARLEEEETIGQPHNVIRHPDMPMAVFKLLWDTLRERQEIFAYILNLASDGAHYWVLAHVTPSLDARGQVTGYHSNRRKPARGAVEAATGLYRRLRAEERRHQRTPDALEASTTLMRQTLAERGQTYDEFVWDLTAGRSSITT